MNKEIPEDTDQPMFEPEDDSVCEATGGKHSWTWNEDDQEFYCDECGMCEGRQGA